MAFVHLIARNRRRWGGYVVHAGVVIIFSGIAGSSFNVNIRQTLAPGESAVIPSPFGHDYQLTYEGMSTTSATASNPNNNLAFQLVALFQVEKDGKALKNLTTEKRGYIAQESPTTEVGIRSSFLEDLYVILSDVPDLRGAVMKRSGRPDGDLHLPGESAGGMDLVRRRDFGPRRVGRPLARGDRHAGARPDPHVRAVRRARSRRGGGRLIHFDLPER